MYCSFPFLLCCLLLCAFSSHRRLVTLWQPRNNSSRTSRYSSTNGAFVCASGRIMWARYPGQHMSTRNKFQPTQLPLNFTSIRAVQQRHNSSCCSSGETQVNLATLIYKETPVFLLFNLRHPRIFKPPTSQRGPCYHVPVIKLTFFSGIQSTKLFFFVRGSFLALSAAWHARDPPVHQGASVGPGRAPWRVLSAFKATKSGE